LSMLILLHCFLVCCWPWGSTKPNVKHKVLIQPDNLVIKVFENNGVTLSTVGFLDFCQCLIFWTQQFQKWVCSYVVTEDYFFEWTKQSRCLPTIPPVDGNRSDTRQ
jgi:hypothetical protein